MSKFLVTGGAGFIGSNIVQTLLGKGEKVRVIDNFITGKRENLQEFMDDIELVEGDIRDLDAARKAVKGVDYILHQAALRNVAKSMEDPLLNGEINVMGSLNMLTAGKEAGVKRLVYASSSSVYGETETFPEKEDDPTNPVSPYAVSKLAGELYCAVFSNSFGLETVALRYFNVFGPRQNPESKYSAVIPAFLACMLENQSPEIHWTGKQSRDFTYVSNVVDANLAAAKAPRAAGKVVNVACGNCYSVMDVFNGLNRILGKDIKPTHTPKRAGDVMKTQADISNLKELLGITKMVNFEEGLQKTVNWFKSEYSKIGA